MKKQLLLLTLLLSTAINAFAVEVEIGGLWYEVITKAKEAKVIQYKNDNYYSGDIVIPESVEYNGVTCSVTSIGEIAFYWCSGLTSVTIPNSVTSIGGYAFYMCSGLTSVTIPNSVTSIGSYAFLNCSGLTSVTIPNSVTSIGGYAFYGCSGLTSVTIPNSVTSIGKGAFEGCRGLTSVTIPNSVTSIGYDAFSGCSGLTSVSVDAGNTVYDSRDNCNAIIETASNTLITGCKSTIIPNSVTSIGMGAFYGCSGLTSVTIPNSVTSIEGYAFSGCSALTSVTIGSGIKNIGSSAFAKCTELTDVYCYAESVPSTYSDAFDGSYIEYVTLHVPTASIDAYKAAAPWSGFKTIVGLDGTIPETKKCATPTISLVDGELQFSCETEGVEYLWEITVDDAQRGTSNKVSLTGVYKVSVYATKTGYDNSDVATAEFTMSSSSGIKGDVNGDGKVDVSDVVGTANIILQKQ